MTSTGYIELNVSSQQLITTEQAWHYNIIPKNGSDLQLELYVAEGKNGVDLTDELEVLFGKKILLEKASAEVIQKTLGKYYRRNGTTVKSRSVTGITLKEENFLGKLISEAHSIHSSDIHIEAFEKSARVRMRIDGKLIERYEIPKHQYPALINKIKIQANLDIAEKRLPQDGRILYENDEENFDIRVSVIPTLYGEKAVLRLLSKDSTNIDIDELGFSSGQKSHYLEAIRKTSGIILISGPTGSGKTTTLYATLKILNKEETNILTIEDPIEYTLAGINQVQLKESIGLTFASALRTFLRQDPDIIMLGEIRDGETAQMAIRAALTGHLVLSTIHTNSAWGTVSRLIDMGVPGFLVAGTINLSVSQRLIRLLCPVCRKKEPFDKSLFPQGFQTVLQIGHHYMPVGCLECYYTGHKGRRALFEVIPIDHLLGEQIKSEDLNVQMLLQERDIQKISDTALDLFAKGMTSLEEIYPILLMNT